MIRETIGAIMTIVGGIYLLYFILPMLQTSYTIVKSQVNSTDPTLQTVIQIGDSVYGVLGFVTIIVVGFIVMLYLTRREVIDLR